ncbi:MAG TPA: DGQHR domain-containing protein [Burkholderiales bacterium]|nr:DGQHR domain-containing protein [Burkholderiales bacterium]
MSEKIETTKSLLHPLLATKPGRQREYLTRKDLFVVQSVHPADVAKFEADGWSVQREGSRKVRIRKPKNPDALLEDQTWCLFYRMGYPEINGRKFKIKYLRPDGTEGEKQVDVFAKDDETVVVAECKARETRGRRSLQKDLHETESLQKPFSNSIRAHFGGKFRPKIIWMYVTNNIIWSEPDLERAAAINVRVVTENEMQYFDSFIRHMGPAGRFQFLAEFLQGQDIPGLSDVRVPATRGKLGRHTFYSFVTTPRHLLKIAYVNHLALNHPDGRPAYQRMITPSRIKEIGGFIKKGGFFPTNLLVNLTEKCRFDLLPNKENADPNIKFGWLYLPNKYKSAWVIDGQHRLYGYSNLDEKHWDQSVAVIAFEGIDTKDEADLFVTINHKQKSVPRSVIVSLQADLKWGSDDPKERLSALSSRLVKTLNSDPTSPFFQRFSVQGVVAKENQSLTMPEVVQGLNKSGLLGRNIHKGVLSPGPLSGSVDDETNDRARRVINGYFGRLREANIERWEAARRAFISTNPGIRAQLLLLAEIIRYLKKGDVEPQLLDEDTLLKHILKTAQPVFDFIETAPDEDIYDKFSRKFGEGGVREYGDNLTELVLGKFPDFGSEEFKSRLAKRSDDRAKQTDQDVIQLHKDITDYVFKVLKRQFGTAIGKSGQMAYWEKGVESPKIKQDAYARMLQDGSKHPMEAYVDVLHLKEIVAQKATWPLFESVFNIPMKGEAKGKAHYVGWLARFNELRRIPAHSSGVRTYEEEDYEFMKHIKYEFYRRRNSELGIEDIEQFA